VDHTSSCSFDTPGTRVLEGRIAEDCSSLTWDLNTQLVGELPLRWKWRLTVPSGKTCVVRGQRDWERSSLITSGLLIRELEDIGIVLSRAHVIELAQLRQCCFRALSWLQLVEQLSGHAHAVVHCVGIHAGLEMSCVLS
jgi:hypothetical protein